MIRINLIPQSEIRRADDRARDKRLAVSMVGGGLAIIALAGIFQWWSLSSARGRREELNRELEAIQAPFADVTKIENQKKELQEKLRVIAELEAKKIGPVRLLEGVSGATPEKLWLTEFADSGGTLRLFGLGVDEQTVADFMRRLSQLPQLKTVDLEETSQVDQDGAKLKKFVIRASINYAAGKPGPAPAATPAPRAAAKGTTS